MTTRPTILAARLQHMADSDIRAMINADALARIKRTDPTPEIRVYGVCHEGEARGVMVGAGQKVVRYVQHAIERLATKLIPGVKIFHRHAATNAHDGRDPIGEVVGGAVREIDGKKHALAAVYIAPEHRDKPLDVASIEANVAYSLDDDGHARVDDVEAVTGIALSSAAVDIPGFPGATLLGAMQAFAENHPRKGATMTLEEIKKAIEETKLTPSKVFDAETLLADSVVADHVKTQVKAKVDNNEGYYRRKLEKLDELEKENQRLHEEVKASKAQAIAMQSEKMLSALAAERKLTERQQNYVKARLDSFRPDVADEAGAKVAMMAWLDGQLKDYERDASLFGVKDEPEKKNTPAGDNSDPAPESGTDLTDPKQNDFIPA